MKTIIANKQALLAFLDKTPILKEFRELLADEWPEVRMEIVKQVRRDGRRPPAYGEDWSSWLTNHLADAANEAADIVL